MNAFAGLPRSGRCRVCGCTEEHACDGGCWWADETHTLCDNPKCLGSAGRANPPILQPNADALTASGMAAYAASQLRFHGYHDAPAGIRETAAECVAPLLRAAAIALELSGLTAEDQSGAVRNMILDYISVPEPRPRAVQ